MGIIELLNQLIKTPADLSAFLKDNKDGEAVKALMQAVTDAELITVEKGDTLTAENLVATIEATPGLKSVYDRAVTKGIDTFKNGKMKNLIADAVTAARKEAGETPVEKEIRELRERIEKNDKDAAAQDVRNNIANRVNELFAEKELPESYKGFIAAGVQTVEAVDAAVDNFAEVHTANQQALNDNFISKYGITPAPEASANETPRRGFSYDDK